MAPLPPINETCDGCPAKAVSWANIPTTQDDGTIKILPLTLCGHHMREFQAAMLARQLVSA